MLWGAIAERLDILIFEDDLESGIEEVIEEIRPNWRWEDVKLEQQTGGHEDILWRCENEADADDVILVRVFDLAKTYNDRDLEYKIMRVLHEQEVIMPMYCRFKNGYAYKFEQGSTLTAHELVTPAIYKQIIAKFHQIHSIDIKSKVGATPRLMYPYLLNLLALSFQGTHLRELDSEERFISAFESRDALLSNADLALALYNELEVDFPLVFCHFDAHMLNIIYNPEQERVTFIDWDLGGLGPEVLDIGIHWERDLEARYEDSGKDPLEDVDFQTAWLKEYLGSHPLHKDNTSEELLEKWQKGVTKACYLSSVINVLWAVSQATMDIPAIDFWSLAERNYNKCKKLKERLGLSLPKSTLARGRLISIEVV